MTSRVRARFLVLLTLITLLAGLLAAPVVAAPTTATGPATDKAVFFASDGLRQDAVVQYAAQGVMPTMADFLKKGSFASGSGLRTQAPPNTGAGWYSLATGAWPGVTGSTNNTFHINGQPFGNRTAAFDANVLQAESIAQSAERGGLKVAQVEWAGGRNATIQGPTIDFQTFGSGRGVSTNFHGNAGDALFDDPALIPAFGLQFDTPTGYAGQQAFPGAAPTAATGWSGSLPATYSPAMEMRLRVIDFGTDKYGLNAWIFDSTNDATTNYDKVLFSRTKSAADSVGILAKGQWADVKVKLIGGANDGKTAGMLIKVEELNANLSRVRLFHTSVSRAIASWPTWPGETGFTGNFEEYLAQKFPTATAADFAILEAGVTSEDTYVEQGLYWATGHLPMLTYVANTYKPDLLMVGMPTTDEFQHQFLGLVTTILPNGAPNPAYDDVDLNGVPDGRVAARSAYIKTAYRESDETLTLARSLLGKDPTTFVSSDHGFAPQFLAIDASLPLVQMGLLSAPQTSNCRPATGETIGSAKACWAGGTVQIYLNVVGRDPAGGGFTQIAANNVDATVAAIKAKFLGLVDTKDWTHDGKPEGWKVIDRAYTKAEARYIPNGPGGSTADMSSPTRTGDLVVFSYPPYQFDAETPGTLIAASKFFGQHGYVPDVQVLGAANVNMRATFLAGGKSIAKGEVSARTIDLAPTLAYMLGIPEPQMSQGRVLTEVIKGGNAIKPISIVGLTDFHGQLEQTTISQDNINVPVGGAAALATMFDEELAALPGPGLILAAGDNVGASPANSGLLQDMPAIDVENAWGLDATSYGNHEFDYGVSRLLAHQARAHFPFLATNIIETATGVAPPWVTPSKVFTVNGIKVGVIGAELQSTPELVSAGATAGLSFLAEAPRIIAESNRLKGLGVNVQVVVIHQGTANGRNPIGMAAGIPWDGPILGIADALQGTTVDAMIVGHTHRVSNLMRGKILVTEGINAGASYSVLQLMVTDGDVTWAGGATRIAKNIGVAQRADVKAIVDDANAQTAVLRNQVIGTQSIDILRDLARKHESAMGNMVADALKEKYAGVEGAWTNSGGLRADLLVTPPTAGEAPGQITWGEMFAVLPFGNRTFIMTLTGAQVKTGMLNAFSAFCDPAINTGRFPQISGLKVQFHCTGLLPVIDGIWKAPNGVGGTLTELLPTDTFRFVTNDFMATGGDGYTVFLQGTNPQNPGDDMLQAAIDYVTAHSPVAPVVQGRIVGP
ncbi:MAG TPA: 5'-nucleotidase C-terminal domain-containing protein [Candidatus Limnocylindrales bacterium]|nr:5'-nucleotidase C-terminal domain-containing protein [Candidatus Limnocylindrales bacterium]